MCTLFSLFQRFEDDKGTKNWLLHPIRESNLQLFALVSIWLSSKVRSYYSISLATSILFSDLKFINVQIHDMTPLSVEVFKSFGDEFIKEQHYTKRDLLDAVSSLSRKLDSASFFVLSMLVDEESAGDGLNAGNLMGWISSFYN